MNRYVSHLVLASPFPARAADSKVPCSLRGPGRARLACMAGLLLAGCVALPADRPADSGARMGIAPTRTLAHPTRTPPARGEVMPTPPATPGPTQPPPTAAALRLHPPSTRTGIAEVDRVIEAVLEGNRDALRGLIRILTTPCTIREGLGGPPKCGPGEPEGTPVEVFPVGGPEGTFVRRADIDRLLPTPVAGLYAVYRVPSDAYREEYWPAGDYGVVFQRPDATFLVALVDSDGIVRLDHPAARSPDELAQLIRGEWVLPPAGS